MKILITADCHLGAPMNTYLDREKARVRDGELYETFRRMILDGVSRGARAVIIAGDLFDCDTISKKAVDFVNDIMASMPDIFFLYASGNHEKSGIFEHGCAKNVKVFGNGWDSADFEDVRFVGRSDIQNLSFSDVPTSPDKCNIVILHGGWDTEIKLKEAVGHHINLCALGHYHTYDVRNFEGGTALYPGTPEGHGFDDAGDKGYVLYDTETKIQEFVRIAKRRYFDIDVDVTGVESTFAIGEKIEKALNGADSVDLVKVHLIGGIKQTIDKNRLKARFADRYFLFIIEDETKLLIREEDYKFDKSLRGEFIREVLSAGDITEEQKKEILSLGLSLFEEDVR